MSDHTDTTLTDTERRYAYEHFGDDDEHFGRCYLEADVESIVAARVAAARAEAWERGAFAGREFQKRLYEYVHPTNISAKQPEMPPNPSWG